MKLTEHMIEEYVGRADKILHECLPSFESPKIVRIKVSRARGYWAQIQHLEENRYALRVSNVFEEILDTDLMFSRLLSCITHELIHTIPACWNHGVEFRKNCRIVNSYYPDMSLGTATSTEGFGIVEKYKYKVICKKCGTVSNYLRKPAVWKWLNLKTTPYCCGVCNCRSFEGQIIDK